MLVAPVPKTANHREHTISTLRCGAFRKRECRQGDCLVGPRRYLSLSATSKRTSAIRDLATYSPAAV
jgi:hypothetical protein